ncbi:MAG: ThiF family adenylyltransferase [Desulfobacterales bacterium]|nr:ThiF family adenylyltransferase [Desulfobacterales bacterium]
MNSVYRYWEEAFSRNIGFVSLAEQDRLHRAKVALPGLGGVGGAHLVTLARTGIGRFHLADFDRFEAANVNRQHGARVGTFGRPKLEVMRQELRAINPFAEVRAFPEGVTPENIDAFLEDVDVLVDSIDFFSLELRRLLFRRARAKGIPAVTAGPIGFGTALIVFAPDRGMTFDEYFDIHDGMSMEEKLIAFFVGLAPQAAQKSYTLPGSISMSDRRGPSLSAGYQLCAAAAAAEVARILLKKPGLRPAPYYCQYDPFARKFHQGRLWFGNRGPLQWLKRRIVKAKIGASSDYLREPKPQAPPASASIRGEISAAARDYLLQAAVRAPSGDNCQPWKFEVQKEAIRLLLDPAADDSFFNVAQIASWIGCGAAVENLVLAAGRCGLDARVTATAAHPKSLDIDVAATGGAEDPLQRFIWERHTNRTLYDGSPLEPDEPRQIEAAAAVHGARLLLLSDKQQIREAARLVSTADLIRSSHRGLHEHLMAMIRFTSQEALAKRDGFPLKTLEAGPAGEWLLRHTRPWPVMAALNRLGLGKMISKISYQGMCSASAIGLLKVSGRTPSDFIQGGRALERVWLTAARLGLDFQPMTAITLFRLRWLLDGKSAFSPIHQSLLQTLWPRYERLFQVADDRESHVMLFRIGHGRPVACRTLRKPLAGFISLDTSLPSPLPVPSADSPSATAKQYPRAAFAVLPSTARAARITVACRAARQPARNRLGRTP